MTTHPTSLRWSLLHCIVLATAALGSGAAVGQPWSEPLAAACVKPTCLALGFTAETLEGLRAGDGIAAADLVHGLEYWARDEEAPSVRLIAIRYQDGRIVRNGVSPALDLPSIAVPDRLEGTGNAVARAFHPVLERGLIARVDPDGDAMHVPVALDAFLAHVPPPFLLGPGGLLAPGWEDYVTVEGTVGMLLLLPEAAEQRDPDATESYALLVSLESVRH